MEDFSKIDKRGGRSFGTREYLSLFYTSSNVLFKEQNEGNKRYQNKQSKNTLSNSSRERMDCDKKLNIIQYRFRMCSTKTTSENGKLGSVGIRLSSCLKVVKQ